MKQSSSLHSSSLITRMVIQNTDYSITIESVFIYLLIHTKEVYYGFFHNLSGLLSAG